MLFLFLDLGAHSRFCPWCRACGRPCFRHCRKYLRRGSAVPTCTDLTPYHHHTVLFVESLVMCQVSTFGCLLNLLPRISFPWVSTYLITLLPSLCSGISLSGRRHHHPNRAPITLAPFTGPYLSKLVPPPEQWCMNVRERCLSPSIRIFTEYEPRGRVGGRETPCLFHGCIPRA